MIKHCTKAAALIAAACAPAQAQIVRSIDFSENPNPVTIAADGVEVTLQPIFQGEGDVEVITSIRANSHQSIIVREGFASRAGFERVVSIGKLTSADPIPSVLLGGFTGGAHCCATLRAITPSAGKLKIVDFEEIDGEPDTSFPQDIDGDGIKDFVRQDDSFRYKFASGAGSFSPPILLNIYKGQIIDVSDQPAFRPVWVDYATKVRAVCADKGNEDRNGACIALAAAGARLGMYSTYLKEAVRNAKSVDSTELPSSCTVDLVDFVCPAGKETKFFTFEAAANWFLRRQGYIE